MRKSLLSIAVVVGVAFFVLSQIVFFVPESQKAIILRLGEPVKVCDPGLNFRIPFIYTVKYIDNRILMFNIDKSTSLTSDKKNLEIDNYACWRIVDPITFIRRLSNERDATERLRVIVFSQLRAAIGGKTFNEMVAGSRNTIMEDVRIKSNKLVEDFGVVFIDVRIKRADLPDDNRQAIFARMNAERKRMANQYKYEGESKAREIRSRAELDRDIILAEAEKKSITIRGGAEAKAMNLFAEAIAITPAFFEFSKSLEVYKNAFQKNTRIIFSTDDTLLKHLD